MLKSIGLLSVMVVATATAAYLPGDKCPSGECQGEAKTCTAGECSGEKSCEGCPSAKFTSQGEDKTCCSGEKATSTAAGGKSCEGCPSAKFTSQGEDKTCCSGEKATSTAAGGKSCEGCPSAKFTSQGEDKTCCSGEKATSTAAGGKSCEGCPSAKFTSQGEDKTCCSGEKATSTAACEKSCEGCPSAKFTSQGEDKTCCAGEKCTACTADGEKCCGKCSSTKLTSKDEGASCGCTGGKCTGACTKDTAVDTAVATTDATCKGCNADCKDCPITAAMAKLPQMSYQVGTEKVCCPKAAGELAKKSDAKIHYVVADKTFDNEGKAKTALVEATEQFVAAFAKPQTCKTSGNITVAGQKACCAGTAAQMAKTAKDAMDKVKFTFLVGEKACHCPVEAEKLAKDSGDVKLFVVGEEKTPCDVTARLTLARAKYKAAVVAMVQTTSETKETSTDS